MKLFELFKFCQSKHRSAATFSVGFRDCLKVTDYHQGLNREIIMGSVMSILGDYLEIRKTPSHQGVKGGGGQLLLFFSNNHGRKLKIHGVICLGLFGNLEQQLRRS